MALETQEHEPKQREVRQQPVVAVKQPRSLLLLLVAFPVLVIIWPAGLAAQAWTRLGNMPEPRRDGASLHYKNDQGVVSVTALAPDLVRVRVSPTPEFGRDHSYALVERAPGDREASFEVNADRAVIRTRQLTVTVRHRPFGVAFATADGESLDEDDPARGIALVQQSVHVWKRLRDDEHVYGFGEKTGPLDKRGRLLRGTHYSMWNSDTYRYNDSTDPIYASVPFFMVLRNGRAHGIFLDNTHDSWFDIGKESYGRLAFGVEGGELDYYFIDGPHPRRVVQRFADLTGRMPLPPHWALGFHQSRLSYYPESQVREIAANFRQRRIPADAIYFDIDYQDGYKPFTWDPKRFPDPARLVKDLRAQGFRSVVVVDPHPAQKPGYHVYDSGMAGDHFVKNADGSLYTGPVWPALAAKEKGPSLSVFPDFSKPATREWWGALYRMFTEIGVGGIWNDMDEPRVFLDPWNTLPIDARHDNEGQPSDHREIHNVYGLLLSRSSAEGLARLRPNERPFVLNRATFAGGQRWATIWNGDAISDWYAMRGSIPMFANMGLSGMPFVGADIGGFTSAPTPELFTRWFQLGVFYPFMRSHHESPQEPWIHGPEHEALNRRAIERRYELLPHIYNVMQEASETGLPAIRPLLLEYPDDPATYGLEDQFLFGRDLLVAPVVWAGERERVVYLPKGDWFELASGKRHQGGGRVRVAAPLEEDTPVFARGGAFVFRQPVVQHTGEMSGQPLIVRVFPAEKSEASFYEDDGISMDYQRGVFARRRFVQRRESGRCVIELSEVEGSYRPAPRDLVLEVFGAQGKKVSIGKEELPRVGREDFERGARGWIEGPGEGVAVRLRDRPEATSITLEECR